MYNRNIEIREAIEAGERALVSLQDARESLGSARNWGLLDLLGGRSISGLVKHVKVDNARQSLNRAKADLNRFSKELSDVRDLQGLNIEIGDFLTFALLRISSSTGFWLTSWYKARSGRHRTGSMMRSTALKVCSDN